MSHVFGVANSSPSVVAHLLVKKRLVDCITNISVIRAGTLLRSKARPTCKVIIALTISDFLRNLAVLNSARYKDHIVFVFASPIRLSEMMNITNLDFSDDPSAKGFGYILQPSIDLAKYRSVLRKPDVLATVKRNPAKHLTVLTEAVKQGSLLTPLMTFIYTLPSSTLQTPVKLAVAEMLVNGLPLSSLTKLIKGVSEYELAENSKNQLIALLKSDTALKYSSAFAAYRESAATGKAAIEAIALKHDVLSYELTYLIAVLNGRTKKVKVAAKPKVIAPAKVVAKPKVIAPAKVVAKPKVSSAVQKTSQTKRKAAS